MPLTIPTTQELVEQYVALFESKLNQNIPLADKAFVRVLAVAEATLDTVLYKFGQERSIQNLALTATEDDLDKIGINYKVYRKPAESWKGKIEGSALEGTIIPVNIDFVSDSIGERYTPDASATADADDEVIVTVTARNPGVNANLEVLAGPDTPETMTIGRQIGGLISSTFEVVEVLNVGADRESDDDYRRRVLNEIRTVGGGGNSADYRTWAEEVAGVKRAYPYAGKPVGGGTSLPGDRTVYIEATEAIDPDGIPPAALLDEVRETINFDPITGEARPPLGEIDDTLFVPAIRRTGFYVEVRNLVISPDLESQTKEKINLALDQYFRAVFPFILGLDFEGDRNDTITNLSVSTVVQGVVSSAGGAVASVGFGTIPGVFDYIYQLGQGEMAKLEVDGVSYV
jgi:uncharacterized phage protein gp47/JayE